MLHCNVLPLSLPFQPTGNLKQKKSGNPNGLKPVASTDWPDWWADTSIAETTECGQAGRRSSEKANAMAYRPESKYIIDCLKAQHMLLLNRASATAVFSGNLAAVYYRAAWKSRFFRARWSLLHQAAESRFCALWSVAFAQYLFSVWKCQYPAGSALGKSPLRITGKRSWMKRLTCCMKMDVKK